MLRAEALDLPTVLFCVPGGGKHALQPSATIWRAHRSVKDESHRKQVRANLLKGVVVLSALHRDRRGGYQSEQGDDLWHLHVPVPG